MTKLHVEVTGRGPALLFICGGPSDADVFAGLAAQLAGEHTVIRYDPRGNSRSGALELPADDQIVDRFADDAEEVLASTGARDPVVFGQSGGGIVGLALVARHPGAVRTLIVHEPPIVSWIPEAAARERAVVDDVVATYHTAGVFPAMQRFMAAAGLKGPPAPPPGAAPAPPSPAMMRNLELFVSRTLPAVSRYQPDLEAVRRASTRVVVTAGAGSRGQPAYLGGVALAERLGSTLVEVPGDHGGFVSDPTAFAAALRPMTR